MNGNCYTTSVPQHGRIEMLPKTVAAWQERLQTGLKCAYNSFRGGRRLAVVFSNRLDCPSSNVALAKQETFRFEK